MELQNGGPRSYTFRSRRWFPPQHPLPPPGDTQPQPGRPVPRLPRHPCWPCHGLVRPLCSTGGASFSVQASDPSTPLPFTVFFQLFFLLCFFCCRHCCCWVAVVVVIMFRCLHSCKVVLHSFVLLIVTLLMGLLWLLLYF